MKEYDIKKNDATRPPKFLGLNSGPLERKESSDEEDMTGVNRRKQYYLEKKEISDSF